MSLMQIPSNHHYCFMDNKCRRGKKGTVKEKGGEKSFPFWKEYNLLRATNGVPSLFKHTLKVEKKTWR